MNRYMSAVLWYPFHNQYALAVTLGVVCKSRTLVLSLSVLIKSFSEYHFCASAHCSDGQRSLQLLEWCQERVER